MSSFAFRIRPAYVSLPGLGAVFVECDGRRRGRSFFDTDLDLRPEGLAEGIELFVGRWCIDLGAARPLTTAPARLAWFSVVAPILTIAAVAKALTAAAARPDLGARHRLGESAGGRSTTAPLAQHDTADVAHGLR